MRFTLAIGISLILLGLVFLGGCAQHYGPPVGVDYSGDCSTNRAPTPWRCQQFGG